MPGDGLLRRPESPPPCVPAAEPGRSPCEVSRRVAVVRRISRSAGCFDGLRIAPVGELSGDERRPGHQIVCGNFQCRGPGGRRAAAYDYFGARSQLAGFGRERPSAKTGGAGAVDVVPDGPSATWMPKASVFAQFAETGASSPRFSPKSGTRTQWRRHTLRPRGMPCRPRMNDPADGIIHAGPGSLSRKSGEGRTRAGGQVATGGAA